MSNYKPILVPQKQEFNRLYNKINKIQPGLSKDLKISMALRQMFDGRKEAKGEVTETCYTQYMVEMTAMVSYTLPGSDDFKHYYIPDYSLMEWMMNTEVKEDSREYFINKIKNLNGSVDGKLAMVGLSDVNVFGVYSKKMSVTILFSTCEYDGSINHSVSILTEDMNYFAVLEYFDFSKLDNSEDCSMENKMFKLAMNFLFYIDAFPEYVIDGAPCDEKRNPAAHTIKISDKIIDSSERFVTPHFRSGHFRHLTSDYFVNKKGSVVFIKSTMVKGQAKTVLNKEAI